MQLLLMTLASIVALSGAAVPHLGYKYPRPTQTFEDDGRQQAILADLPLVLADDLSDNGNDVATNDAANGVEPGLGNPVSPQGQQFANPYGINNGAFPGAFPSFNGPQSNFAAPFPPNYPHPPQGPQGLAPNFPPGFVPPQPFASQPIFPAPFPNYPQQGFPPNYQNGFDAGQNFPPQNYPGMYQPSQNVGGFPSGGGFPFGPAPFPYQPPNGAGFGAGGFGRATYNVVRGAAEDPNTDQSKVNSSAKYTSSEK